MKKIIKYFKNNFYKIRKRKAYMGLVSHGILTPNQIKKLYDIHP